jgi:hypothetical protein
VLAALGTIYPRARLAGFDISETAIEIARGLHPRISFSVGAVHGEFDVALVMDVVEHVEDCFGFVRSLRPHAALALFHFPLELACLYLLRPVLMNHRRVLGHIHYFTRATALALLEDTGFEIVAHRYTPAVVDFAAGTRRRRLVTHLQRAGFRIAPDLAVLVLGGYGLMVAARPSA